MIIIIEREDLSDLECLEKPLWGKLESPGLEGGSNREESHELQEEIAHKQKL